MTVTGEGMPPGGPVDFYADLASLKRWDDGTDLSQADRAHIVDVLPRVAGENGFKVAFD